jgi:hypothetical protein
MIGSAGSSVVTADSVSNFDITAKNKDREAYNLELSGIVQKSGIL